MPELFIRLSPERIANPDSDIRYRLPDVIVKRSAGIVTDNGYDYADNNDLILYFETSDVQAALSLIEDVLKNKPICDNPSLHDAAAVGVVPSEE